MRLTSSLLRAAFCLACAAGATAAQRSPTPRDALVVSPSWVATHLTDPALVLLHVGDRAEYEKTHIRGARFVALDDVAVTDRSSNGLSLEMLPADRLRQALAALGISDDSRIVVYYGKDRVSATTRVLLTLDYAGLGDRSALLDGGMGAWIQDGHPVTGETTPARTGHLSALSIKPIVVTADFVRAHMGKPAMSVVDARIAAFYDGAQTGGAPDAPHRTGHIAGAKSVPYTEITDEQVKLKSIDQLAALFTKAGVQPGDTVIGYCHIGQQATAMLFAARTLGHPVLLYDGSFEDWSKHPEFPVENPSTKRP